MMRSLPPLYSSCASVSLPIHKSRSARARAGGIAAAILRPGRDCAHSILRPRGDLLIEIHLRQIGLLAIALFQIFSDTSASFPALEIEDDLLQLLSFLKAQSVRENISRSRRNWPRSFAAESHLKPPPGNMVSRLAGVSVQSFPGSKSASTGIFFGAIWGEAAPDGHLILRPPVGGRGEKKSKCESEGGEDAGKQFHADRWVRPKATAGRSKRKQVFAPASQRMPVPSPAPALHRPASLRKGEGHCVFLVLNYEFPPLGGGAGNATACLAREWAARGHEVEVLTGGFRGLPRVEQRDGFTVRRIRSPRAHPGPVLRGGDVYLSACSLASQPWRGAWPSARTSSCLFSAFHPGRRRSSGISLGGTPYVISLRGGDVPGFR